MIDLLDEIEDGLKLKNLIYQNKDLFIIDDGSYHYAPTKNSSNDKIVKFIDEKSNLNNTKKEITVKILEIIFKVNLDHETNSIKSIYYFNKYFKSSDRFKYEEYFSLARFTPFLERIEKLDDFLELNDASKIDQTNFLKSPIHSLDVLRQKLKRTPYSENPT